MADVPIFVSMPSRLNDHQQAVFETLQKTMRQARLAPSTVGRSVLPLQSPLGEVYQLARRSAGGLILGFRQTLANDLIRWPGSKFQEQNKKQTFHPSPWNQIEAGILYSLGVPMLILAEEGVSDGIFERGVCNHFIHEFSAVTFDEEAAQRMETLILDWSGHVINYYMEDNSRRWRS